MEVKVTIKKGYTERASYWFSIQKYKVLWGFLNTPKSNYDICLNQNIGFWGIEIYGVCLCIQSEEFFCKRLNTNKLLFSGPLPLIPCTFYTIFTVKATPWVNEYIWCYRIYTIFAVEATPWAKVYIWCYVGSIHNSPKYFQNLAIPPICRETCMGVPKDRLIWASLSSFN